MSDHTHIITNENGRFRLDIWETNKGAALGYVKWAVYILIDLPDFKHWTKVEQCTRPVTADIAERDGYASLNWYAENYIPESGEDEQAY